ncbi:MAG: YihY family inner membrane protein, partial [Alphaproteobacteria bacterium]|nr:YihY family inner membrane protein [Alphaproteobacteria bacterium]
MTAPADTPHADPRPPRPMPARLRRWAGDGRTFTVFAARRYLADQCVQTASALTYTTLLALVPLMTITVGIISAFPGFSEVQTRIQSALFEFLVPQVGSAVQEYLLTFTANAGKLTGVGVVGLIATAILLLSTIEMSFNRIWRVQRGRGLVVRLLAFWAVLSLTPLLAAASLSLTTRVIGDPGVAGSEVAWRVFVGGLPLLFELVGFTVLYLVLPSRPVRWIDAAVGGAVAAVLFEISKAGFALYLSWFPIYETIYGALSTVPIFLVWLYLAWSVVLFGAVVSASLPDFRAGRQLGGAPEALLPGPRLTLAVAVIDALAQAGRGGVPLGRRTL